MSVPAAAAANFDPSTYAGSMAVVALKQVDGKGDVGSGYEVTLAAREVFPKARVAFTYVDARPTLSNGFNGRSYGWTHVVPITDAERKNWEVEDEKSVLGRVESKAFDVVFVPCSFDDGQLPPVLNTTTTPVVKCRECGAGDADPDLTKGHVYTMGVKPKEVGILFPDRLWQRYLSPQRYRGVKGVVSPYFPDSGALVVNGNNIPRHDIAEIIIGYAGINVDEMTKAASLKRLAHLASLPEDLLTCILGVEAKTDFAKAIADFNANSRLYCGYSCEGGAPYMSAFLHALCPLDGPQNNDHITVCFQKDKPNNVEIENKDVEFKELIDKKILFANRFKTIQFYAVDEKTRLLKFSSELSFPAGKAKGNRILTVIFKPLQPEDADNLARASERETLGTGESSLLKYLAMGMFPAYALREHKVSFIMDLIDQLKKSGKAVLAGLLIDCYFENEEKMLSLRDRDDTLVDVRVVAKGMQKFFQALRDKPKLRDQWDDFVATLATKHNFKAFLPNLVAKHHLPSPTATIGAAGAIIDIKSH